MKQQLLDYLLLEKRCKKWYSQAFCYFQGAAEQLAQNMDPGEQQAALATSAATVQIQQQQQQEDRLIGSQGEGAAEGALLRKHVARRAAKGTTKQESSNASCFTTQDLPRVDPPPVCGATAPARLTDRLRLQIAGFLQTQLDLVQRAVYSMPRNGQVPSLFWGTEKAEPVQLSDDD